jgi:NAD(P)-dependent dehydrogenase (short-subunit alcohol dehydrogenase family)
MLLEGKVALITGAATGIGRAGAKLFAQEGAEVIVADVSDQAGEETVAEIKKAGQKASYIHVDLSSVDEIEQMVKQAVKSCGRIDIFWHNAGVYYEGHIDDIEAENYDREMTIGLRAGVFGTRFVLPVMKRAGWGSILYTSSMVGLRPTPYMPGYSLTHGIEKAGTIMLMRCLIEPLARYNIRVNCLCPGPVETEKWKTGQIRQAKASGIDPDEYYKASVGRIPLKRTITEAEIANAAAFLVSDKASGVTGVAFPVDGGFSAV